MSAPWVCVGLFVVLGSVLASCGPSLEQWTEPRAEEHGESGHPASPAPALSLWPGEHFVAQISAYGFAVGESELWVEPLCQLGDQTVLPVRSTEERTGVYGALEPAHTSVHSWLEPTTGWFLQTRTETEDDQSWRRWVVAQQSPLVAITYHHLRKHPKPDRPRERRRTRYRPLPPDAPTYDIHSILGVLRTWSRQPIGAETHLYVIMTRRLYRVDLVVAATESISTSEGTVAAVRLDGQARRLSRTLEPSKRSQHWSLWISDDDTRLPLQGTMESRRRTLQAELTAYHRDPEALDSPLHACPP